MILNTLGCSKDRPALLELLLRSFQKHYQGDLDDIRLTVIWRATTDEAEEGYRRVIDTYPFAEFEPEIDIAKDIKAVFRAVRAPFTQMFVDDMVFVRPWGPADPEWQRLGDGFYEERKVILGPNEPEVLRAASSKLLAAVSLRMAPWMDHCYTLNTVTPAPMMLEGRTWCWPGQNGDWRYPHSIDGTIWRTNDVAEIFLGDRWKNLHELEPAIVNGLLHRPLALCYEEPRLVNIVTGSVQDTTFNNRNPALDETNMTTRFLDGERVSLEAIEALPRQRGPHFEAAYEWTNGVA